MPDPRPTPSPGVDRRAGRSRATSRSSWTATAGGRSAGASPRTEGHAAGEEVARSTPPTARSRLGVKSLTVYAFSTENWRRPVDEVRYLMNFNRGLLRPPADELDERGRAHRASRAGATGACRARVLRQDGGRRGPHRAQPNDDPQHRLQLRGPRRDRRRGAPGSSPTGSPPARSTRSRVCAGASTTPRCPTPTWSCARRGSTGSPTSCSGSSPTPSSSSRDVLWPDFRREHLFDAVAEYQRRERRFGGAT